MNSLSSIARLACASSRMPLIPASASPARFSSNLPSSSLRAFSTSPPTSYASKRKYPPKNSTPLPQKPTPPPNDSGSGSSKKSSRPISIPAYIAVASLVIAAVATYRDLMRNKQEQDQLKSQLEQNSTSASSLATQAQAHKQPVSPKDDIMPSERFLPEYIAAFPFKQKKIIFVLGGPGSGKGTNSTKLVDKFGFVHLSAGDLLRAEQNREGSKVGQIIKNYIAEGTIVPYNITIALIRDAIMENSDSTTFLIDGFPRSLEQARAFEKAITNCELVLFYDCPESELFDRIMKRAQTSGRIDDNEATLKNRFKVYSEQSYPVISDYMQKGKVRSISCIGSVDEVFDNTLAAISSITN